MTLSGALWTVRAGLLATVRLPPVPPSTPFTTSVDDPRTGRIPLSGRLHEPVAGAGGDRLLVGLHGLGGSADSAYLRAFSAAAVAAGHSVLRLNARGADLTAPDIYHAGLTGDLDAVLADRALARFRQRVLVGFSLGGLTALRWAAEREGTVRARGVVGVVAVCSPLDLEAGATALDEPGRWLYRQYLLPRLRRIADTAEARGALPGVAPRERRRSARRIREFDRLVVAPRFGFASAEDYYEKVSVARELSRIAIPAWIVVSEQDPMVPAETVRPALAAVSASTEVTWAARGGHVSFPSDLDLGRDGAPRGLHGQLLDWVAARWRDAG